MAEMRYSQVRCSTTTEGDQPTTGYYGDAMAFVDLPARYKGTIRLPGAA